MLDVLLANFCCLIMISKLIYQPQDPQHDIVIIDPYQKNKDARRSSFLVMNNGFMGVIVRH